MSVAPLSTSDQEPADPGPDGDGWALLQALRRRMDDQAAQGRKTQQQVTQLAESIGALVEHHRRRTRGLNLNSFIAYLIFTMLCGAGFYLLYRSRAHELSSALDRAEHERDAAVRRADDSTAKVTAREHADVRAWEVYQLLDAGKRSEAAGKLAAVGSLPLSRTERAILAARAHETQVMEVDAALKAAAASFKAGRHAEVIGPLEAALLGEPAGARASAMHYFLGVAYAKGNDLAKAVPHLQTAVAADVDQDDARFQLASALDRSGQYGKARSEYDRFATAHPQSGLAVFAMRRSATLARMPATAPVPVPAPTQPPTPPSPSTPLLAPARPSAATPATSAAPPPAAPPPPPTTSSAKTTSPIVAPKLVPSAAQPRPATLAQPRPSVPAQPGMDAKLVPTTPQPAGLGPMAVTTQLELPAAPSSPKPPLLPPSRVEPSPQPWPTQPQHDPEPRPEPPAPPRPAPAPPLEPFASAVLEPIPKPEPRPQPPSQGEPAPQPPSHVEPPPQPWPAPPSQEPEPAPQPRPAPREEAPIDRTPLASSIP